MLKRLIAGAFIFLLGATYAQTDQLNAKKYWKFRNNFRRDFVKIGSERGEGIPIASRKIEGTTPNSIYPLKDLFFTSKPTTKHLVLN